MMILFENKENIIKKELAISFTEYLFVKVSAILGRISFIILCPINYLIFRFFLRFKIQSRVDLRKLEGPYILASNHSSWLDAFFISASFPVFSPAPPIKTLLRHCEGKAQRNSTLLSRNIVLAMTNKNDI